MLVNFVNNMVKENMGVKMMKYAPYIATLLIYAVFGALISMIGLRSMTADINVTATWALMTFVLITYNKIKANGFKGYLKALHSLWLSFCRLISSARWQHLRLWRSVCSATLQAAW